MCVAFYATVQPLVQGSGRWSLLEPRAF